MGVTRSWGKERWQRVTTRDAQDFSTALESQRHAVITGDSVTIGILQPHLPWDSRIAFPIGFPFFAGDWALSILSKDSTD